MGFVANSISFP